MEIKYLYQCFGVIVVYVIYDQGEVLIMFDWVVVFYQGEIQQIELLCNFYEQLCNIFVVNFIGENNCLFGQFFSCDGECCVVGLLCGEKVEVLVVNVGQLGELVILLICFEWVCLNGVSEFCVNCFFGCVVEFVYLGDYVCVCLEVCGCDDFFVKQLIVELDLMLSVGDVVLLGWQVEYVRVFDFLLVV